MHARIHMLTQKQNIKHKLHPIKLTYSALNTKYIENEPHSCRHSGTHRPACIQQLEEGASLKEGRRTGMVSFHNLIKHIHSSKSLMREHDFSPPMRIPVCWCLPAEDRKSLDECLMLAWFMANVWEAMACARVIRYFKWCSCLDMPWHLSARGLQGLVV